MVILSKLLRRTKNKFSNLTYDRNDKKLSVNKRNYSFGKRRAKEITVKKSNYKEREKERLSNSNKKHNKLLSFSISFNNLNSINFQEKIT